ncbi:MAG: hybrid sensor histidine kinase/response regulator [Alphaproteobacteria bacterium]|nr:hybrid sensor histidine kinase/response regulator [Alphaproteobacteria bacterium]
MDDLLPDFLTETNEGLAEIDTALVALERNPGDAATLQLIFRLVHTIKGTCGFLGLGRLERVAHATETVLGRFRDGALAVSPGAVTQVLRGIDAIKLIVTALERTRREPEGEDSALIADLEACAEGRLPMLAAASGPTPGPTPGPATGVAPDAVPDAVAGCASEPAPKPAPEPVPSPTPAKPAAAPPPEAPAADPAPANAGATDTVAAVGAQTIRVHVDVAEDLMTLVSELVLTRNQLLQLAREQDGAPFTVPLQRLSHITSDLQEGVMKLRMQPIGNAWNKLPRLVRDLARETGKKIELVMRGADTELDRQVLELIKDPLTHMVRNCADHGLEPTEARLAAGKPETGRITLDAFHEGGHIIIEIADDGRGLSTQRIREKALVQGLASEAQLAAMSETEIQQFIFRPGFSTAPAITAVSGRGVGMDVVRANVQRIGGSIELRSAAGRGTAVTIKIPLTLAIVSALIVAAGGERFAIPQIGVLELVRASGGSAARVECINGAAVLRLRDRLLPLVDLAALLGLADPARETDPAHERFIVVTQVGTSIFGIIVDRVFDTEEIVVKPVAPILRHVALFSGNTILGDGSVIMILDPNGIARAVGTQAGRSTTAAEAEERVPAGIESSARLALLLFRAGGAEPKAVPLGLVARLEDIPRERIERIDGRFVTQYRGQLMPLVPFAEGFAATAAAELPVRQPVLVFADRERVMGLMVDAIDDVLEDRLRLELGAARPGFLGSAVVGGRATDVIDVGHHLARAFPDWWGQGGIGADSQGGGTQRPRILVVEDSAFFRALLGPLLVASGYEVVAAETPRHALALRERGFRPDLIVSDIEMPEMDGFAFAEAVRASGAWADLPLVALTSRAGAADMARGRAAGFTDYVAKFDRQAVLAAIAGALALGAEGHEGEGQQDGMMAETDA